MCHTCGRQTAACGSVFVLWYTAGTSNKVQPLASFLQHCEGQHCFTGVETQASPDVIVLFIKRYFVSFKDKTKADSYTQMYAFYCSMGLITHMQ